MLTFDDGPDELVTPLILDVLLQLKARATFFVSMQKVESLDRSSSSSSSRSSSSSSSSSSIGSGSGSSKAGSDLLARMAREGHDVAIRVPTSSSSATTTAAAASAGTTTTTTTTIATVSSLSSIDTHFNSSFHMIASATGKQPVAYRSSSSLSSSSSSSSSGGGGGGGGEAAVTAAAAASMRNVQWSVDSKDGQIKVAADVAQNVLAKAKPG